MCVSKCDTSEKCGASGHTTQRSGICLFVEPGVPALLVAKDAILCRKEISHHSGDLRGGHEGRCSKSNGRMNLTVLASEARRGDADTIKESSSTRRRWTRHRALELQWQAKSFEAMSRG